MAAVKLAVPTLALVSAVAAAAASWNSFISYDNEFVSPDYVLSKPWITNPTTHDAADTVVAYADVLYDQGPWSVTFKPFAAPSGNKHDYLSWAPYWWPDCSGVGNTTELTPQEIWVTCPYKGAWSAAFIQWLETHPFGMRTGGWQTLATACLGTELDYLPVAENRRTRTAKTR